MLQIDQIPTVILSVHAFVRPCCATKARCARCEWLDAGTGCKELICNEEGGIGTDSGQPKRMISLYSRTRCEEGREGMWRIANSFGGMPLLQVNGDCNSAVGCSLCRSRD